MAGRSVHDVSQFLLRSPRGWAVLAALVLVVVYSLNLSAAGPWDPWETHYGEVARQILVRSDPMDLWWQGGNGGPHGNWERSFASKPALPFWCMALSMKVFGVGTGADPAQMVQPLWPELALRLPSMMAGLLSCAFLGYVVWRLASPRAGVLVALVMGTMPQFAIASRQALTDMFFVGPVVLAMGAWAMAWLQPDRELRTLGSGIKQIPWDRAYLAFFVLLLVAAVAPLAVLHQHVYDPLTWRMFGRNAARAKSLQEIQSHLFIYWGIVVFVFVRSLRWRRRSQPWMGILYLAGGLSLIGKGMIGPGVIGALVLVHLIVSGRWHLLLRCGLLTGVLLFALPAFPWHHAMILYRGDRWIAEWIIDNNLRRFSTGEQKQAVGGFAFYLETLGLAALPWSALIPLSVGSALRVFSVKRTASDDENPAPSRRDRLDAADHGRDALLRFGVLWFVVSLLVISLSTTKYYHYLLPSLPPLALLLGLWIDRVLEGKVLSGRAGTWVGVGVGTVILAAAVRDSINAPAWIAHLTTYLYTGFWTKGAPDTTRLIVTCAPFAVGLLLWGATWRRSAVGAWLLSGVLTTGYIIGDYIPAASESWSQRSAMRLYFAERGPEDRLISWWFYYRGETFFSKGDVWVMKDRDRKKLAELFAEYEGKDASLWFITIESHAKRLKTDVPVAYRDSVEEVYRSFHYVMLRVKL